MGGKLLLGIAVALQQALLSPLKITNLLLDSA
jgi:hypothetical protein